MSENERQSQTNALINHKVQSTLVIYLRCGGIVNLKKIEKGLLMSPPVKTLFFKLVNIWHSYWQNGELCRALSSSVSSVVARRTKCMRQPPFLPCNFAKCSPS